MTNRQNEEELEKEIEVVSDIKNIRRNFTRLTGQEFYDLMSAFQKMKKNLIYLESLEQLYDARVTNNIFNVYLYTTKSECRVIYYALKNNNIKSVQKKQVMISFRQKSEDPAYCILQMNHALKRNGESLKADPSEVTNNKIYGYYDSKYGGKHLTSTSLDLNSAYIHAFKQVVADWETKTLCDVEDVKNKKYEYYQIEKIRYGQVTYRYMYYKENTEELLDLMYLPGYKVYGYEGIYVAQETLQECYDKRFLNKSEYKKWKNIMVIYIGTFHKRSGKNNRATIASSIYAWMEWYMSSLVQAFKDKGYKVILVNTDAIKIVGEYNTEDNLIPLGEGLGEFKVEYVGESDFITEGHYLEGNKLRWKGMPEYMRDGVTKACKYTFDTLNKEKEIYIKYAITN